MWRAVPAIVAAAIITFSRNHSAVVGLSVFGGYAIVASVVLFVAISRIPLTGSDRIFFGVQAVVTWTSGIIALFNLGGGLSALVLVLSIWAALTAALELYAGYRHSDRAIAREWLTVGAFTAILAIIVALFPINDVYAVGLFGAYGAILGVYLVIAGLSLRSDGSTSAIAPNTVTTNSEEREAQS
ncbi:MAG: hypothetical protein JJE28_01105 [Actinomycetales bacterium]|nr:hypothetical protein [Actinomycetales bacterium]